MDLEKAPDVAYQDILKKFDLTWGVKGLIMTWSNLVVTWKDRPYISIISCGLRWVALVGCILDYFAIEMSIRAKNKTNQNTTISST